MQFKKHTYNIILVAALAALTGLTMFGQDVRRNRSLKKASVAQFTPDSISSWSISTTTVAWLPFFSTFLTCICVFLLIGALCTPFIFIVLALCKPDAPVECAFAR